MFLRPGFVPGLSWVEETIAFVQQATGEPRAAVFAAEADGALAWLSRAFSWRPRAEQGLVLRKSFYGELGGHRAEARDPETDLVRRIARSRLTTLRTTIGKSIV